MTSDVRRPKRATSAGASSAPAPSETSFIDSITATVRENRRDGSTRWSSDNDVASANAIAAPQMHTSTATTGSAEVAPIRPTATPAETNDAIHGMASSARPICAAVTGQCDQHTDPGRGLEQTDTRASRVEQVQRHDH